MAKKYVYSYDACTEMNDADGTVEFDEKPTYRQIERACVASAKRQIAFADAEDADEPALNAIWPGSRAEGDNGAVGLLVTANKNAVVDGAADADDPLKDFWFVYYSDPDSAEFEIVRRGTAL